MTSRTTLVVGLICLIGVVGGCASSDGGEEANVPDLPTRRVPVEPDPPGSPQTLRALTSQERKHARRIIAADRRFQRIVGGERYRLRRIIPMGTQDNRGPQPREVLIGTRSEIVLENPRKSVVTTWPFFYFPGGGDGVNKGEELAYEVKTVPLRVAGLRSLVAFVDLKRRTVAGLSPEKADKVVYPPGWPTVRAPSGR